jgi:plasmid maintenance system antidote protein VapI
MEKQHDTLRDLLTQRNIKMDAAATLADVSASTISRICAGSEKARPKTVVALAQALGVSARRMQALCDASYDQAHPVAS